MFCFWEIFKNNCFEEHLRTVASELTLESDCLELCIWSILRFDQLVIKTKKRPGIYFILFALFGYLFTIITTNITFDFIIFTKFLKK